MKKEERKGLLIDILLNMISGIVDGEKLIKVGRAIEKIEELYGDKKW